MLRALPSPQSPLVEPVLISLLNEILTIPNNFTFVLEDYHLIDAKPIDKAVTFLLEQLLALVGELSLCLWLLVKGVNVARSENVLLNRLEHKSRRLR